MELVQYQKSMSWLIFDYFLFYKEQLHINKNKMIKNPNDPSGLGLFSKCARNQAAKIINHRQNSLARNRTYAKQIKIKPLSIDQFSFAKQQSREQRQRRYKKDETPSVGQYKTLKQSKPKMVWDILKIYNSTQMKKKERSSIAKGLFQDEESLPQQVPSEQLVQKQISSEINLQAKQDQQTSIINKQDSIGTIMDKSQCLVNMSRMTGRRSINYEQNQQALNYDVLRSINYLKPKITKNIDISKKDKIKIRRQKGLNIQSNYECNYRIIKPQSKGLLDFSQVTGRKQTVKTEYQYSYQHYDYDNYVWNSNSRVFPNTKINLIQFKKQSSRYKKIKQVNSQTR